MRIWILLILVVFAKPSVSELIEVPIESSTISGAIESSQDGDTILVHRGAYPERLVMPHHDLILVSNFFFTGDSADLYETIIDASDFAQEDFGSVLTFDSTLVSSTVVCGFVLTGGHGKFWNMPGDVRRWGGAISIYYASPTIRNCIITANTCTNDCAIYAEMTNSRIAHCQIYQNCGELGVVDFFYNFSSEGAVTFEWNDIHSNFGCNSAANFLTDPRIGALRMSIAVRNNHFHDYDGFGLLGVEYYESRGECTGNIFERLIARNDGSVVFSNDYAVPFDDNTFRDLVLGVRHALTLPHDNAYFITSIRRNWFENIENTESGITSPAAIFSAYPNLEMEYNVFINCRGGMGAIQLSQLQSLIGCRGFISRNQFYGNHSTSMAGFGSCLNALGSGPLCEVSNNWFDANGSPICSSAVAGHPGWDCANNYWGDSTGPYHPTQNPDGRGDTVDVNTNVIPWLTSPPDLDVDIRERLTLRPDDWTMEYAFPNPFNSSVNIRIVAQKTQPFEVNVYNTLGQRVGRVWQGVIPQNAPTLVRWDGKDERGMNAASGVYYLVAQPRGPLASAPKAAKAVLLR